MPKFPEFIAFNTTAAQRRAIERAAAAEERSVAAYIRRVLAEALKKVSQ